MIFYLFSKFCAVKIFFILFDNPRENGILIMKGIKICLIVKIVEVNLGNMDIREDVQIVNLSIVTK